jgi:alkyl hydroperoxide reductase subunit F
VQKVLQNPKFKGITDAQILVVEGEQFVTGLRYKDPSGEHHLPVSGIFVEIGLVPNTEWLGKIVKKTDIGQIITDPYSQKTSHARIWAAGDCTDGKFHQNNIAAGDAVKALEDMYLFVHHER